MTSPMFPAVQLNLLRGGSTPPAPWTYSRASAAYRVNEKGLLESVASGAIRYQHDKNGRPRGALLEPARTNLCLRSAELDNGSWSKTSITVTANAATAPDGNAAADTLQDSSAVAGSTVHQDITISNDTNTQTISLFVKQASGHSVLTLRAAMFGGTAVTRAIAIDASTGEYTAASALGSPPSSIQVEDYGNGWYRVSFPITNNNTGNTTIRVTIQPAFAAALAAPVNSLSTSTTHAASAIGAQYVWGVQYEVGAFRSSYIATAGTTVTRAADALSLTTLPATFNAAEGTAYVEFERDGSLPGTDAGDVFSLNGAGSGNNEIRILGDRGATAGNQTAVASTSGGSTDVALLGTVAPALATPVRIAYRWRVNDAAWANSLGEAGSDVATAIPVALDRLVVANSVNNQRHLGTIRHVAVFPRGMTNAQLAALAA